MKNFVMALLIAILAFPASLSYADHGGQCPAGKGGYQCPITEKFMKKAHFILENKDEIGLTEEQVKTIKDLKLKVKKGAIKQGADLEMMMLDLEGKMSEDQVDVEGINAMIDEGFSSMSGATKEVVSDYAKLKGTLTPEQMTKLKSIWAKKK